MPAHKKPAEQRVLEQGSVDHRPVPMPLVTSARVLECPPPPKSLPKEGKRLWETTVRRLFEIGFVTEVDVPALHEMCRQWAHAQRLLRVLDKQGYFTLGSVGQLVTHPALRAYQDASNAYIRIAREFGMTPSARASIGLTDAAKRTLQMDIAERLGPNPRSETG
jgi:P27 family predicted phage terminase small subunit